jgi:hypothetical protein
MTNLVALEQAMMSGTKSVSYEGKTVVYRDLTEMLQLWQIMRGILGLNKSNTYLVAHNRGFGGVAPVESFTDDDQQL